MLEVFFFYISKFLSPVVTRVLVVTSVKVGISYLFSLLSRYVTCFLFLYHFLRYGSVFVLFLSLLHDTLTLLILHFFLFMLLYTHIHVRLASCTYMSSVLLQLITIFFSYHTLTGWLVTYFVDRSSFLPTSSCI